METIPYRIALNLSSPLEDVQGHASRTLACCPWSSGVNLRSCTMAKAVFFFSVFNKVFLYTAEKLLCLLSTTGT